MRVLSAYSSHFSSLVISILNPRCLFPSALEIMPVGLSDKTSAVLLFRLTVPGRTGGKLCPQFKCINCTALIDQTCTPFHIAAVVHSLLSTIVSSPKAHLPPKRYKLCIHIAVRFTAFQQAQTGPGLRGLMVPPFPLLSFQGNTSLSPSVFLKYFLYQAVHIIFPEEYSFSFPRRGSQNYIFLAVP